MTEVKISENDFSTTVEELFDTFGWKWVHFRQAMKKDGTWYVAMSGDGDGCPDYFALRDKRVLWAEIKSESGELSPEQYFWLLDLIEAGQEAYLWNPSDFEQIVELVKKE